MSSKLSFCIVVPIYNEELGVERCIRVLCEALDKFPYRTSLIAVNDGSTDKTGTILNSLLSEYANLQVVSYVENIGYGGAVRKGIDRASEEGFCYALFMDSDLTNDPRYIGAFVEKMLDGVDVIKASRYVSGGEAQGVPAFRVIISVIGNKLARFLFGVPILDCTNGFQAIKISLLREMPLSEDGFAIIMEQLYYLKFLAKTFHEVPYTLVQRSDLLSKSSFYYRPKVFVQYLKYPIKRFLNMAPKHIRYYKDKASTTHDLSRM
ncbi:MAG: glycosyltransferase family 2 protein [Acidobacteriota bacterium]|nr:glycosyltransferase family 2 protein [Acidobacteriota bacterium]